MHSCRHGTVHLALIVRHFGRDAFAKETAHEAKIFGAIKSFKRTRITNKPKILWVNRGQMECFWSSSTGWGDIDFGFTLLLLSHFDSLIRVRGMSGLFAFGLRG